MSINGCLGMLLSLQHGLDLQLLYQTPSQRLGLSGFGSRSILYTVFKPLGLTSMVSKFGG